MILNIVQNHLIMIEMARRSDHSRDELRTLIIDKAWDIVAEEGLSQLTARHLGKKIGYAPGTIYNLFETMDALHLHLNMKTLTILFETLDAFSAKADTKVSVSDMEEMAQAYFDFASKYRPHWMMLFNLNVTSDNLESVAYQKAVEKLFTPLESLLNTYFPMKNYKEIKKAARILWSSVHGLCYLEKSDKILIVEPNQDVKSLVSYLIKIFIVGMSIEQSNYDDVF